MKAIDLFCGCGGIASGLKAAGFEIIAGADIEKKYISSFQHNFPEAKSLLQDLSKVAAKELMADLRIREGELTLLAGGPPCQGFSKNVPRKDRLEDSANNQLINTYLDYCAALMPKMILMENVAEMKNGFGQYYTNKIYESLESLGYKVTSAVLNAAEYGVPQRRRRAFFIAHRDGLKFSPPKPLHLTKSSFLTVWDAISDLPSVENGMSYLDGHYPIESQNDFQRWARAGSAKIHNHISRELKKIQYERIASLLPGQGLKDLPQHLQVKGGYSGAYGRLTKDMVAPTITRWVFHPGSGRWGHPVDKRILTIREAARIQGFPDTFEFVGTYTDMAGQLGNAVPPLLAYRIVKDMMNQDSNSDTSISSSNAIKSVSESLCSSDGKRKEAA